MKIFIKLFLKQRNKTSSTVLLKQISKTLEYETIKRFIDFIDSDQFIQYINFSDYLKCCCKVFCEFVGVCDVGRYVILPVTAPSQGVGFPRALDMGFPVTRCPLTVAASSIRVFLYKIIHQLADRSVLRPVEHFY